MALAQPSWLPSCFSGPCMWVVSVADFLNMRLEKTPCHEELLSKGLLVRWQADFFCIFVSHQWLGIKHPDPNFEQLPMLQQALRHLLAGSDLGVDLTAEFFGKRARLSDKHRASIKDGYIWMDWFSIPQHIPEAQHPQGTATFEDLPMWKAMSSLATQDEYIRLIPKYVEVSDLFVVLAPPCRHDDGTLCGFRSWSERGWCRLELWCQMMSENVKLPPVLVSGSDQINFAMQIHWLDHPPHEGQFTIEADRHSVNKVTRGALVRKMISLKASKKWAAYRYFVARYETLLGLELRQRTREEFMADFNFSSLHSKCRCMSPIVCAALSGDAEMIRVLCSEGLDVNRFDSSIPEVNIFQPMSPVMFAAMLAWRNEETIVALLQQKADIRATTFFGTPMLGYCKTARTVELLIQYRADVNQQERLACIPPLSAACENAAPRSVLLSLLKHRACVNPIKSGVASVHPLACLAMRPANSNNLELAKLLLDARADANMQYRTSGIWRAAELLSLARVKIFGPMTPRITNFILEWSTTPLGVACFFGFDEMVKLLLDAEADPEIPNDRGHTPLQLAESTSVLNIIRHHQTTFAV
ncbi:unnamed protein product [Effrenium voratum]|nr:unnamed protein product [Effrenium voratum]